MTVWFEAYALVIITNLLVGIVRLVQGPRAADRMLSVQLFGTLGVALLLVLAHTQAMPALRDIALLFVLLALLAVVVFTRRIAPAAPDADDEHA